MPPLFKSGLDGDERAEYYAPEPLFKMFREHPQAFYLSSEDQIAGFEALEENDKQHLRDLMASIVADRPCVAPPFSPFTEPCWERRALLALTANNALAFAKAVAEGGESALSLKVDKPRLGGDDSSYLERDVPIWYNGGGPTDLVFESNAHSVGLFYTGDSKTIWGASIYQGDGHLALGEEMLVGYDLKFTRDDTLRDIAKKNGRSSLLDGM